jgi:hypothetical protein
MVDGLAQLSAALQIFSTAGTGTEVLLWLPVAPQPVAVAGEPAADHENKGTILVIDDEPAVRSGTAEMISALGYDVVQAARARASL